MTEAQFKKTLVSFRDHYHEDPSSGAWVASIKGSLGNGFEMSVVRENNSHGLASYGWFDANKRLVSTNYHQFTVRDEFVWDELVRLTHRTARFLNERDRRIDAIGEEGSDDCC